MHPLVQQQPAGFARYAQGVHCMMDGYLGNVSQLDNEAHVYDFLFKGLPREGSVLTPYTLYFDGEGDETMKGVTGCYLGFGVHMTMHTYSHEEKQCFFFDSFGLQIDAPRAVAHTFFETEDHHVFYANRNKLPSMMQAPEGRHYGPHLLLSGTLDDAVSAGHVYDALKRLPTHIGMTPLLRPLVMSHPHHVSGLIVIAESHIAVHVNNLNKSIHIDIFSCKPFAVEEGVEFLMKHFRIANHTKQLYGRGTLFHGS